MDPRLSRRAFLRLLAATGGVATLLAACAPAQPAQPTAPAKPTEAPKPSAPTPAPPASTAVPKPAATAAPAAKTGVQQVLRLASNAPPPSFNPLTAVSRFQSHLFWTMFSTLTQPNPAKGTYEPDLAESWEVAPDGSSYTFRLNRNAKWHDGTPVTAKDVAFSYTMAANPKTESKLTGRMSLIKGAADYTAGKADRVEGIKVLDAHTIRFEMEFPNGLFMIETASALPMAILPEHLLGSVKPEELSKQRFFIDAPVGSGPFKFVKYVPDQFVEVEAHAGYHFGRPKLERIVFPIIKSLDTMQVAMERGEVDLPIIDGGTATRAMYEAILRNPSFMLFGTPGTTIITYIKNYRHEHLRDKRILQALLFALDRKKLVERFNAGNGTIVNSFLAHPWYQKPEWADRYPYNPDRARQLLREANWDTNRTVPVNVITFGNEDIRAMVAAEQQMLADVGFKISFREMELPVWVEKFYDTHDFELVRVTAGIFPDPDGFLNFHLKTTSKNAFGWANPEFDQRIEQGRRLVDQAQRAKFYQDLNEELLDALPVAPVYLENAWWMKARRWHVPLLADVKPATSLTDVPIFKTFLGHSDQWKYHMEQWEIR